MRTVGVGLLAMALVANSTFAYADSAAMLPAGKPAGVKEATALGPNLFLVLLSAGIIIGGIALAVSADGKNGVTTPTTSGTSTASLP